MATDYQDRIGDRLDHPENVPPELAHLIPDDVQRVKRILEFPVSGRVLDVGCSDGAITRRIKSSHPGVGVIGSDVDTSRWTRVAWDTLFVEWDIRIPLHACRTAGLMDGWVPLDAVYACEVFEHLTDDDADKALVNVLAVLKLGGDLILTVPNRRPADRYTVQCRDRWRWPDHRSSWTWGKLSAWLRPHFTDLEPVPLYDGEPFERSIWLIVRAKGKR